MISQLKFLITNDILKANFNEYLIMILKCL